MRTDTKYTLMGALIGTTAFAGGALLYQKSEREKTGSELTYENFNGWHLLLWALLGGTAGVAGGRWLYQLLHGSTGQSDFDANTFLKSQLQGESLKREPVYLNQCLLYREDIINTLTQFYGDLLAAAPYGAGSFHNRTAIVSDYDIDIIVPFKKRSFRSLTSMHADVLRLLTNRYALCATVRGNKKTVSITFRRDGRDIRFDIVPGREVNEFFTDGKLKTHVSGAWPWSPPSSHKIDVFGQRDMTINKPEARQIIKLIKMYCHRNHLYIPPVIITQLVTEMTRYKGWSESSLKQRLLRAMERLAQKLQQETIIDRCNSNNNLAQKISDDDRMNSIELLQSDIAKIEGNPSYLRETFGC